MQLSEARHVHFIAVGGAGMSGIAWVLRRRGIVVSGSDLVANRMTQRLAAEGAHCFVGHRREQLDGADLVVVSSAIHHGNCELQEARQRGLPVWHRAKALGAIMTGGRSVGIAGSHGKTTTTAMVGLLFEKCGCDPTVIVGGDALDFGGTAKSGRSDLIISELDESDGSFLHIRPDSALILNIEADHLDHYADHDALVSAFQRFVGEIPQPPVVCSDDPGVRRMMAGADRPVVRYSVWDAEADYAAAAIDVGPRGSRFDVMRAGKRVGRVTLPMPGLHNVSNAVGALAAALEFGLEPSVCCEALAEYRGVERRLTVLSESDGLLIADDYAHHPTEIAAALGVGRTWADTRSGRLVCVFQPHRYTRTAALGAEFGPAFAAAHSVIVTDVYAAGERPIEGVTGELIAESVRKSGHPQVRYVSDFHAVAGLLAPELAAGDVVMTVGAGNIAEAGVALRDCLCEDTAKSAPSNPAHGTIAAKGGSA